MLSFVTALGQNIVLLFALTYTYSLIWPRLKPRNIHIYRVLVGILFGVMAALAMLNPIPLAPGVFTDGRDIFIVLAGLVGGLESAAAAGVLIMIVRWMIGGVGVWPGIGIAASAIIVAWLAARQLRSSISKAGSRFFIALGLLLTLVGRLWVLTLPDKLTAINLIETTSAQLAILSVFETLLLGHLLAREARRQETAAALAESEDRFTTVFRASPVAISISTLTEGRFVDVNDSFLKLTSFTRQDMIGRRAVDLGLLIHPEQRDQIVKSLQDKQSVENLEMELRARDGAVYHTLASADRIELDGVSHLLILSYDITERKKIERALRLAQHSVDNALDSVVWVNPDGDIVYANKAAGQIVDFDLARIAGHKVWEINKTLSAETWPAYWSRIKQMGSDTVEITITRPDGEVVYLEMLIMYTGFDDQELYVGYGRDISERRRVEMALRESEKRYRAIVEDQTEFIVRWNPNGLRTFANGAYCRYFDLTYDQVIGTSFMPLIAPDARQVVQSRLDVLTVENPVSTGVHQILKPDGSTGWHEWTDRALFDAQGRLIEMQSVGRDISQRIQADDTERELRNLAEALVDSAAALNSMLELDQVLDSVLGSLGRTVKHDSANIMLIEGRVGRIVRTHGYAPSVDPIGTQYSLDTFTVIDELVQTNKAIVIRDTRVEPRWVASPESERVRSIVGIPINLKGEVIGIINLDSAIPNFFDDKDAMRLQAFSDQVATAIHNGRLYRTEQEQRKLAEALRDSMEALNSTLSQEEVLNSILNNLGHVLKHDAANVMLVEDSSARVVGKKGYSDRMLDELLEEIRFPIGERRNLETMVRTLQPVIVPDTAQDESWVITAGFEWVRSYAGAPIQVGGEVIGFLNLDSAEPGFFEAADSDRLITFAHQAAVAMHNARIYESERQERKLAETLQHTASTLLRTLNLDDTLKVVMDQLAQVVTYDQAMLLSVEEHSLRVKADRGFPTADNLIDHSYDYAAVPLIRNMLASGEPVILSVVDHDGEDSAIPGMTPETRCWMAIPLQAWGIVTGLLVVGSEKENCLNAELARAAVAFAQQAAIAINNVRTVDELSETVQRLREAQTRLAQATRLTAAGEIAAGVAHQLNNPLTAVIAEVSLMLRHLHPSDEDYESATIIQMAAQKAAAIVQRQLNLSKSLPYELLPTDVNASLSEALALVRAQIEPSARLVVRLAPNLPLISASPEHLSDVWLNLLLNARDGVEKTPNAEIHVETEFVPEGNAIKIVVKDNGEGIPQDHLASIFDPFYTTRASGHGLGLSVCYEVVRRHNGTIEVDSRQGSGTTMTVVLPSLQKTHPNGRSRSGKLPE